ncbi:ABC transporter permease [Chloroflexota bacterium]
MSDEKKASMRLKLGIIPAVLILILFVVTGIFADFLAPHSPTKVDLSNTLSPPFFQEGGSTEYLFGTDQLGRDVLSRIIYGARVSITIAAVGVLASGIIGSVLGILAGYHGGWVDIIVSRGVDLMMGLPTILLALVIAVVLGPSLFNVIMVIIIVYWSRFARLARAETLRIREMDYVSLARMASCSNYTIMWRHIWPNVLNSLIVLATFNIGTVITFEASLSFLGAGVPPPAPTWGGMCSQGRDLILQAWWISFMPGFAITLIVLAGNLFGDWVRDKLDPKLQTG